MDLKKANPYKIIYKYIQQNHYIKNQANNH